MFDLNNPLSRIKEESTKAHRALLDYFEMGNVRSLPELAKLYKLSTTPVPTRQLSRLKVWSTKFSWQNRVAQENENSLKKRDDQLEQKRHGQSDRDLDQAKTLSDNADKLQLKFERLLSFPTEKMVQTDEDGKTFDIYPIDPTSLIKLSKEIRQLRGQIMDMQRVALALPTSYKSLAADLDVNVKRIKEMDDDELIKFIQNNIMCIQNDPNLQQHD